MIPFDTGWRFHKREFEPPSSGSSSVPPQLPAFDAAKVLLHTDWPRLAPDWDDVAYVRAEVVDASGIWVPKAADLVRFAVSGPGEIVAVDNADNASHESFRD